jgi:hypothetical protein
VQEPEIHKETTTRLDGGGLGSDIRAKWTAIGTVGHWAHTHIREKLYDAMLTIESVDGVWKITGLDLPEETRVDRNAPTPPQSTAAI